MDHVAIGRELLRCQKSVHPGVSLWTFLQLGDPARIAPDGDGCGAAMRTAPVGVIYPSDRLDLWRAAPMNARFPRMADPLRSVRQPRWRGRFRRHWMAGRATRCWRRRWKRPARRKSFELRREGRRSRGPSGTPTGISREDRTWTSMRLRVVISRTGCKRSFPWPSPGADHAVGGGDRAIRGERGRGLGLGCLDRRGDCRRALAGDGEPRMERNGARNQWRRTAGSGDRAGCFAGARLTAIWSRKRANWVQAPNFASAANFEPVPTLHSLRKEGILAETAKFRWKSLLCTAVRWGQNLRRIPSNIDVDCIQFPLGGIPD